VTAVPIWESVLVALDNIRAHKLRSFLTIIGVVIGVAAVITVVNIGQAGKTFIAGELERYADGVFIVMPNPSAASSGSIVPEIDVVDLERLRRLSGVRAAAGFRSFSAETRIGKESVRFNVTGTSAELARLQSMAMEAGRFFTASEERAGQQVLVVESDFAERLSGTSAAAIGRRLTLGGKSYRIVGVYRSDRALFSVGEKKVFAAYAPLSAVPKLEGESVLRLESVLLQASSADEEFLKKTAETVRKELAKRHRTEENQYFTQTTKEAERQVNTVFGTLQTIIGSIAGISLAVGGIGVTNIMLVSVTERTREIGIRKAIGASPGVIMTMFLIEAIVLCLIGGILGMGIGLFGAFVFSHFTGWPFSISWWPILLSVGFSTGVGVFFGLYPANKASRLQPIESLRYE